MSTKPKYWVVVPAAGQGLRMGKHYPKQYLHLHGKPILQHTLERLYLPQVESLVVGLAPDDNYWPTLNLPFPVLSVTGGAERCHTVFKCLQTLQPLAQPQDWVLIHDAARPCVQPTDLEKLMTQLADHPVGGLLALPVRDTMKRADEQGRVIETISRINLWHALTPQMFRFAILLEALQNALQNDWNVTDDAQAVEKLGYHPILVEGQPDNLKITHPQDLSLAAILLQAPLS